MLNLFRYVGLRHLQLKPGRSLLTTLGVAFGIALYVAIAIINHSTKNSLKESIESIAGKAKLSVSAGPSGFDESKLENIKKTTGVANAVAMVEARAFFEGGMESSDGIYISGVDLLQEQAVRTYKATDQRIIDDPLTFLNQPDSIILTEALAKQHGLVIDSKVNLSTANGIKTFTVRGLLEPEGAAKAYGGSLAIMDIDGARMMFGKENKIDRVDVIPVSGADVEVVRTALEKTLGSGFIIETPEAQSSQMQSMLESYQIILTFFSSLALMVGLFLVMNSISVSVAERKKEIGTLRALGATRNSMVTLFVTEVIGIGLVGSSLGCLFGRILADHLVTEVVNSVSAQFQTRIEVSHLEFTHEQIFFSIAFGTIASALAALLPSLKAAKVHPLESMKKHNENFSDEEDKQSKTAVFIGLGLLLFMTISMILKWGKIWAGIDLVTKVSSVLGSALFGPFLVFIFIRAFRTITKNYRSITLKLSQENLLRSRKRTSSNVTALMVGLFLVMMIATVRTSFHDTLTDWLDQIFVADLMVASNGRMITADVQLSRDEIQAELLAVPGVKPIGDDRGTGSRIAHFMYQGKKMVIKAMDHYADFYQYKNFAVQGADRNETTSKLFSSIEPTVLVTRGFLTKQNKEVGDMVELDTPSGGVNFKIIGEVIDFASPEGVFYMNRKFYKKYWKDSLVTAFVLNIVDGANLEQVRSEIDRRVGKKWNLVTISNAEFKQQMQQAIERTFAYTKAIEFIALLVGLLGLLNTLLISVMERTRELGMLRAVGATRQQISIMIMIEAVFQGFFGAIVAILLGSYVGKLFVEYSLSSSLGWIVQFHFPRSSIFSTLVTGVIVAVIAGILPSKRASQLNIREALDYE